MVSDLDMLFKKCCVQEASKILVWTCIPTDLPPLYNPAKNTLRLTSIEQLSHVHLQTSLRWTTQALAASGLPVESL